MTKIKCRIQVTAGNVPNQPLPEFTKAWEWQPEEIIGSGLSMTPARLMEFHANLEEAHKYAEQLEGMHDYAKLVSNPGVVLWVRLEWVWL